MTKVLCADASCRYNDYGKCTNKVIKLSYLFRGTLPSDDEREFRICRSYEPSDIIIRIKKYLEDRQNGHTGSQG